MKETIRCCISCILPCGALDVIRIVHASGRVEEISGTVSAGEIMQAYPKHVLKKPPSPSLDGGGAGDVPKAVILPPNAELQRGKIYFLMPVSSSSPPEKQRPASETATAATKTTTAAPVATATTRRRRKKRVEAAGGRGVNADVDTDKTRLLLNERYLSEILSEKVSSQRDRRRGRVAVWRPHLESISEVSSSDL